jgi:hypothetical protein
MVDRGFQRHRIDDRHVHVEDEVAVVGAGASAARLSAQFHQFARDVGARHRNHFDRQRELAQHADQLARVGNADELLAARGHNFFPRQRAAAALDHGEMLGDFVGAVDVDFEFAHAVEIQHLDAVAFQAGGGRLPNWPRAVDAALTSASASMK